MYKIINIKVVSMKKLKIMIVDDSAFSIAVLKNLLESEGHEVVGSAMNIKEAVRISAEVMPDLITMDMTLPDGDGIECSKNILKHNKNANIIAVSSMMDDEIVKKARLAGIKGYLQKPVDKSELHSALESLFEGQELFYMLNSAYEGAVRESAYNYIKRAVEGKVEFSDKSFFGETCRKSAGFSVTVGIIGRHSGRFLIDISDETADKIVNLISDELYIETEKTVSVLNEMANIIAGNTCSMLNSINRSLGLRVSPPTLFHGKDININFDGIDNRSFVIDSQIGEFYINMGFKMEDTKWI